MEALNAFHTSCSPSRESFFFLYLHWGVCYFFRKRVCIFPTIALFLGTAAEPSPKARIYIFTRGFIFESFLGFTRSYNPLPVMRAVLCGEKFGNVALSVKTCPTHLQVTFTQHSNTVRLPRDPLWKPYYSISHNVRTNKIRASFICLSVTAVNCD